MYSTLRAAARISRGTAVLRSSHGRRSVSSTSTSAAMEQPKQQQDAVHGGEKSGDDKQAHSDPITHSFGEGYSTRADEEGFGTIYTKHDNDDERPGHPGYDTSQGSEVREKEKGRHSKDDKHRP